MTPPSSLRIALLLAPGIGVILLFIGTVIYMAVSQSIGFYNFQGESGFSIDYWSEMIQRKSYRKAIQYSLYIGFVSSLLATLLAYPLALWLRKPFFGSLGISAALKAPLLVHGIVASFLFINVISYHGILNQFMVGVGIWNEPRQLRSDANAIGVLILQIWKNMPFALLLLSGSVQAINDDWLDAARDLGSGSFSRFRKIVLPLTLGALQASMVLIFIGALADYTFQTLVGPTNVNSITQLMTRYKNLGKWNDAGVIAVSLMIISLLGSVTIGLALKLLMRSRIVR